MAIEKIVAQHNINKINNVDHGKNEFKKILEQKKSDTKINANHYNTAQSQNNPTVDIKKIIATAINSNDISIRSIQKLITKTNAYSPEKLLSIQYKTSALLLRQQMFGKTVEISANTLKSFTQMQV